MPMPSTEHSVHSGNSDQEPILASWKISEVLRRYPDLLETLIELSPAFSKLRNPVMRRVQSKLVTVSQAAGIAGIEPALLTRKLNQAAGITAVDSPDAGADSTSVSVDHAHAIPSWSGQAKIATELDVRPLMARGEEPFKAIMSAARTIPVGEVLRLQAGFEPLPLYDELAKQGFTHFAQPLDGTNWQVDFHRDRPAHAPAANQGKGEMKASSAVDWSQTASSEVTIDVSELVPPEPMIKILQALESLPDDGRLLVHHVRRPMHLYDRLDELGYLHDTRELAPNRIEVLIQKQVSAAPS